MQALLNSFRGLFCLSGPFDFKNGGCTPAKCGTEILSINEECDDGNTANGDGCDENCKLERGFICQSAISQKSNCTACSKGCSACSFDQEYKCSSCSSGYELLKSQCSEIKCSDGIVNCQAIPNGCDQNPENLPVEDWDDGNNVNGDGCSSKCLREKGFACFLGNVFNALYWNLTRVQSALLAKISSFYKTEDTSSVIHS